MFNNKVEREIEGSYFEFSLTPLALRNYERIKQIIAIIPTFFKIFAQLSSPWAGIDQTLGR